MEQNSRQRIDALDALRGITILGILLLNISGFALLRVASFNPMHSGGDFCGQTLLGWD